MPYCQMRTIGQNTLANQFVGSICWGGVASRLEVRTALQMDLPVLGEWNGRTLVRFRGEWRARPAPGQTGALQQPERDAGCLERNLAGKALEPGRQQLSVDQQRALVAEDVNCMGILRAGLRAAGRREGFTALGNLGGCIWRTAFSFELHSTRKALLYWSRLAGSPARK